jgi:hypothetical protein
MKIEYSRNPRGSPLGKNASVVVSKSASILNQKKSIMG